MFLGFKNLAPATNPIAQVTDFRATLGTFTSALQRHTVGGELF